MSKLKIDHLTPAIGSMVHGLDLSDQDTLAASGPDLRRLLFDRQVIFFQDQKISPAAHVALAAIFGDVREVSSTFPSHPDSKYIEILKSSGSRTGTDVWHADLTWQKTPPLGACLYAVDVPEAGGDTMWASMTAAYDSLDPRVRDMLEGLVATHNWEGPELLASIKSKPGAQERYDDMRRRYPPIEHPVVKVHPETGRKLIFVNSLYTRGIAGLSQAESTALTAYLSSLATVPEYQVRFRWRPGSIAIWDNRAVQHYAVNDYHPYPRTMHRVAIF